MSVDKEFLKALTEAPSVGTSCGPVIKLLTKRFGNSFNRTFVEDGFCLFQKVGAAPSDLKAVLVAHMDEIGGCVYGPRSEEQGGGFHARCWGNQPEIFANATLQAWDYLGKENTRFFPIQGEVEMVGDEKRLVMHGDGIRPYRTAWTFKEDTTFDGDIIEGKALDPRVTLYTVVEAVRRLNSPHIGAMLVMAEECAMDVARKGVTFLQRHSPNLELIVNADVPWIENIGEGCLDMPAIRIFEGRNFIDPSFGIRTADKMDSMGVEFHLSAARSGSQTLLFTPIAHTISIALPSDRVHMPRVSMSLLGTERCQKLLESISENGYK